MPLTPQTPLSSPGLTGRPSTPRPIGLNSGFPAYWIPAFAGMTGDGAGMTGSFAETTRTRSAVVPANAGTHSHRSPWLRAVSASAYQERSRGMGPGVRRDDEDQE